MAKDATKIFGGPAAIIELDDNSGFSTPDVLGYADSEVSITYEKVTHPTLSGQLMQSRVLVKWSIKLQQTDTTTLALIKAGRTAERYIRITDYNSKVFPGLVPVLLTYAPAQPFNGTDVHTILVEAQIQVEEVDDAITFQA